MGSPIRSITHLDQRDFGSRQLRVRRGRSCHVACLPGRRREAQARIEITFQFRFRLFHCDVRSILRLRLSVNFDSPAPSHTRPAVRTLPCPPCDGPAPHATDTKGQASRPAPYISLYINPCEHGSKSTSRNPSRMGLSAHGGIGPPCCSSELRCKPGRALAIAE